MRHKSAPPLKSPMPARTAARCATVLVLVWGGGTGALLAQNGNATTPAVPAAPAPQPASGLQIGSISAYGVYYSSFSPVVTTNSANLPSEVAAGGSIVFNWTKFTERSSFFLTYTPSYTGYVRNTSLNALNHSLSLTISRKIAPQWTFGFSAAGTLISVQQSLFAPTTLSNVASASSTFNDLAAGLLSANFANNPQLGAILSSSPLVQSPLNNLFYGQRMFTSSARVNLSYSYSPRLSVTFSGGGNRSQHVEDSALGAGNTAVIPNTTSGAASVGISYSLSPLTQIGGTVSSTRSSSLIYDGYTTTSLATLGRTLGGRWVAQLRGGVGFTNAVRQISSLVPAVPAKPGPVAGGSLTYKTLSQTFLGSFDRGVSDSYGLGASTNSSASAAWHWRHPGSSWGLDSSFGWQQLQGSNALANTSGWNMTAGLNRAIGAHIFLLTQYSHLTYSGGLLAAAYHYSQDAVRVSIGWTPHPAALR
jgi:hypothetical protein